MKYIRNIVLIIFISVSVLLAGCVSTSKIGNTSTNVTNDVITIKYFEDNGQIISSPDLKLLTRQKLIAPINLSNTLESESVHGGTVINASEELPKGFRTYGYSETYYSNKSYVLVQYKVYDNDNNNDLNNSMDLTVHQYTANGFITKTVSNKTNPIKFKGRVIILEANSTANVTNVPKDANVDIVLFGYDTVIGKIGVEDYKNRSLNESLNILDSMQEKLKIIERQETATNNYGIIK